MAHRDVSVGWKLKALAFNIFDRAPYGEQMYYAMQRNVTKTIPRKLAPTAETASSQLRHAGQIARLFPDLAQVRLLEIGAGWDLYANLIYYCMGVGHQTVIDIRRWAKAEAINAVIAHLQADPPPGHVRLPSRPVSQARLEQDLDALYGIRYLAPFDARATGLPAGSVDVITTTSVFEHIPAGVCDQIIGEFRRVIKDDGYMSHTIDYSDHYAHADPAISPFNYLRFDERQWGYYNPGIHYQNRLRTADFVAMFTKHGFDIVELIEWRGDEQELSALPVSVDFAGLDREALLVLGGHFLLRAHRDLRA